MTNVLPQLNLIKIYDPRVVENAPVFPVVSGSSNVDYRQITTTNVSASSIGFTTQSTGDNVYLDRKIGISIPVRMTLSATVPGAPVGTTLINPGQFCLRPYPIQNALDSINMQLNNTNFSLNPGDWMSALTMYNIGDDLKDVDMSKCPTVPVNQSQDLADLYASNRSPMALYDQGSGIEPKNFPFTVVSQSNDGAGNLTAVVDFVSTEYLMVSPLFFGASDQNSSALRGVRTLDLNLTFVGNPANRMCAIDNVALGGINTYVPTVWQTQVQYNNFAPAFSYADNQPKMLLQFLTPQLSDIAGGINTLQTYPYYKVERFATEFPAINAGISSVATNNQISLASIPNKMYVYIRDRNSVLQSNPFLPDSFCSIDQISIQWGTLGTVLGSASQKQLYDISVLNGLQMGWQSWSGQKMNKYTLGLNGTNVGFGSTANQYSGSGSVLCLSTTDLGLGDYQAPGKSGNFSVQLTVNYTNVSKRTIQPTLYLVTVQSGVFTLYNSEGILNIGFLTSEDIVRAEQQSGQLRLTFNDVNRIYGGNFFDSLRSGLSKIWSFIKPAVKGIANFAAPAISAAAPEFAPLAMAANNLVQGLGGGRAMTKTQLRNRLR